MAFAYLMDLIDLYLLDLFDKPLSSGFDCFGNQLVSILRGTIRGDPQVTLYHLRSPILFIRLVIFMCNHNEAERSVWVNGPSSGKEQQCGSQSKMSGTSWHAYVCAESARAWARELVEALGTTAMQSYSSAKWFFHLGGLSWSEGVSIIRRAESNMVRTWV